MKPADAQTIYLNAETMLRGREYVVTGSAALNLAFTSNLSAYDCEYVALAEEYNCRLITSDKKIVRAFQETAIQLTDFAD